VTSVKIVPGASARSAFRLGILSASAAALALLGFFYWTGQLTLALVGFSLLVVFPVYLVLVASALSVWLGYSKDATDLRPVYREKDDRRKTS
jgi:membrane protein implicated in regulation of membrane protease activity